MPLPVCWPKRSNRCALLGAQWGFGTQDDVYVYEVHAWVPPSSDIVQYLLRSTNLHDTTVSYALDRWWPNFGGPRIIGDKGYCCLDTCSHRRTIPNRILGNSLAATQYCENALKRSSLDWWRPRSAPSRLRRCVHSSYSSSWPPLRTISLSPKRRYLWSSLDNTALIDSSAS